MALQECSTDTGVTGGGGGEGATSKGLPPMQGAEMKFF